MVENTPKAAELAYLPPAVPPSNHGHTVAAWVTMIGITLGALVAAVALVLPTPSAVLFWAGLSVVVAALLIGWFLRQAGLGQKPVRR